MNRLINISILLFSFLYILGAPSMTAQSIDLERGTILHEDKLADCISVSLDPEPETLKEAWRAHLKDRYDFKLKGIGLFRSADVLTAEEVVVQQVSPNTIDFHTRIVENDKGSEMKVFASFGYDAYISKDDNSEAFNGLKDMTEEFLKAYLPTYYSSRVSDTKQRVKTLMQEEADLEKAIADDESKIEELEKKIAELKERQAENTEKLQTAKRKLEQRKEKMEEINLQVKKL